MHQTLLLILGLLFVVFLLVMLAQRIRIAYPIFLVVAGLAISFIPGVPHFHLDPEVIFILFLPPLLYEAAWYTSWHSFWKWKQPIALLAFGLVFFTSTIIAYTSTFLIPGFTLALGFLLGGIVSPPDAVAASTVLKGMSIPKRIMTILEGESLVNDASSLIVFKFALVAVLTGTFSFQAATGEFFLMAGMGIVVGLTGANVMYAVHRFLPTTPPIDAALTIMTPYILFLAAEHFHFSGIMAVVSGGLFMTYRSHEVFQTGSTRVNMLGVWTTVIFAMNALVFILIGLELPEIIDGLGEYSVAEAVKYGLIISAVTIAVRFAWVYPITYLPRWLSKKERQQPSPGWKGPLVISWAGMRGVVSLATALSIPLLMTDGTAFPQRNLIIFITFIVIFVTLVLQGLTLPFVIKFINLKEIDPMISEEEQQAQIQIRLSKVAIELLDEKYAEHAKENELIRLYKSHLQNEITDKQLELECLECSTRKKGVPLYHQAAREVFGLQRKELFKLRKEKIFSDEEIRNAEMQIDLDELKITGTKH
jgi:monovalent cation/hydrogen antiporter